MNTQIRTSAGQEKKHNSDTDMITAIQQIGMIRGCPHSQCNFYTAQKIDFCPTCHKEKRGEVRLELIPCVQKDDAEKVLQGVKGGAIRWASLIAKDDRLVKASWYNLFHAMFKGCQHLAKSLAYLIVVLMWVVPTLTVFWFIATNYGVDPYKEYVLPHLKGSQADLVTFISEVDLDPESFSLAESQRQREQAQQELDRLREEQEAMQRRLELATITNQQGWNALFRAVREKQCSLDFAFRETFTQVNWTKVERDSPLYRASVSAYGDDISWIADHWVRLIPSGEDELTIVVMPPHDQLRSEGQAHSRYYVINGGASLQIRNHPYLEFTRAFPGIPLPENH